MRRALAIAFALGATLVLTGTAGSYDAIVVSGDSVVADIVRVRAAERGVCEPGPEAHVLEIRLERGDQFVGDEAAIVCGGGRATVRGSRRRALVQGVGVLLRQMTWQDGSFSLPDGEWAFRPQVPLRQAYFARQCHNVYHMWNDRQLARYCEDLMLWGFNSVHVNALSALNFKSTYEEDPEARQCLDVFARLSARLKELDMMLQDGVMVNLGFIDTPDELKAAPNKAIERKLPDFGARICPNAPGAMDYILRCQRALFASLKRRGVDSLDCVRFWPYDEGGCGCDKCHPWGANGYLKIVDALVPEIRREFPSAKTMVSTWYFTQLDWTGFYKWFEKTPNRPDYVLADDYGPYRFPTYPVEHALPADVKLVTFPEISMNGRSPWGGYGAVCYPEYLRDRYRQTKGRARGFCCYSEGIYEDLNKVLTCGIYASPSNSIEETCDEYARYELGLKDGRRLAELVRAFEKNLQIKKLSPVVATNALQAAEAMEVEMLPRFRTAWRWRELYLRAVIDFEASRPGGSLHTVASDAAFAELVRLSLAEPHKGDYKDKFHGRTRPPSPGPEAEAKGVWPYRPANWRE